MFKNRSGCWTIIGVVVALGLIFFLLSRCQDFKSPFGQGEEVAQTTLPASVQRLVPPSWSVIKSQACDFDGDDQDEWLVIYRYDSVKVHPANQPSDTTVPVSPIGGAIYDAELELPSQTGASQYQITSITPYRLLPDFASGKGQGYLGESAVQTLFFPPVDKDGVCKPTEVGFLGYSRGNTDPTTSLPTSLSLFYWVDRNLGYQGSLFIGNARIDAVIPTEPDKFVTQVTTYNLLNDRSLLCQAVTYSRSGSKQAFLADPGSTTLDFCYGAPGDPTYPEGVVAALLRGSVPSAANSNAPMPPGNSFLLPGVSLPDGINPPVSILAITNTASSEPAPGGGHSCTAEYEKGGEGWWCGQLEAVVTTEVPVSGVVREVAWKMMSVSLKDVVGEMHWRISNMELR